MTTVLLRFAPILLAPGAALAAQQVRPGPFPIHGPDVAHIPGRLLVSGFESDAVHSYRAADGAPLRRASGVPGAQSMVLGPDGFLYVCAEEIDQVLRVDPKSLTVLAAVVADDPLTPEDENGPLDGPTAAVFGPGADLYVASFENDQVLRYDGRTGAYEGVFIAPALGGLNGPDAGTKFGPDGFFYVPSFWNDRVLRYDGGGVFMDEFVAFREGGLRQPRDLVFHRNHWYVASSANGRILRYDAAGNFMNIFATVGRPYSLAFNHMNKDLYVVGLSSNGVFRFDGDTGGLVGTFVPSGSGGIIGAVYLLFVP